MFLVRAPVIHFNAFSLMCIIHPKQRDGDKRHHGASCSMHAHCVLAVYLGKGYLSVVYCNCTLLPMYFQLVKVTQYKLYLCRSSCPWDYLKGFNVHGKAI